jgi:hypothetical protein
VVVTQQSQPYVLLRPPLDVLTGGTLERDHVALALTTDSDLKATALDRRRQLAALAEAAAAAAAAAVGARGGSRHPATPARAASRAALLSPAPSHSTPTGDASLPPGGWPAEHFFFSPSGGYAAMHGGKSQGRRKSR